LDQDPVNNDIDMSSQHESRRNFLRNTSLIGAAIPLATAGSFLPTGATSGGLSKDPPKGNSRYSITVKEKHIEIIASILVRKIDITGNRVKTTNLSVDGNEILSMLSPEFRITFQRADPNRRPVGLKLSGDKPEWADGSGRSDVTKQPVEWKDPVVLDGDKLSTGFRVVRSFVTEPRKGVTQLHLRHICFSDHPLRDVSIDLYYEIYDGYPVIRKWMRVINNGSQWLKVDQFTIDDITLAAGYSNITSLTPEEKGAESSIIAFSNADHSCGIIATSEIPSALRKIERDGPMGYASDYFEWVVGPSENFESEPVFHFAFSGKNVKTISGISTALDRAVENPFKDFLRNCIGLRGNPEEVPAPIWCSYTNFLVSLTDANMREQADIAARIGFVTFQLDEGWAKTPSPGGSEPGPTFPDFESTCNYIRSKGLKLGLWISCFRGLDSKDIAAIPDGRSLPLFTNTKRGFGMSFSSEWRDYFANDLLYMHDRYGMSYVKVDLTNISKGDIADRHESRTKKESLLRGLRGLLQVNKKVGEMAPDIWTQVTHEIYWNTPGPAADIAVLKYACAFHTNPNTYLGAGFGSLRVKQDWDIDPLKMRKDLVQSCWQSRQRFFSHRGLPLYSVEFYAAHAVNIKGSLLPEVQDRQICSWLMGAPTVFAGDLSSLTEENIRHYRKRFDLLKRLQSQYGIYRYFQYSGVPEPTDTGWHWWGKLNDKGHGIVVVIRGSEGETSRPINIPWVLPGKNYKVTGLFSGKNNGKFSGSRLQQGSVVLELPVYGQEILEISPAD
jgi:hypothetical protein